MVGIQNNGHALDLFVPPPSLNVVMVFLGSWVPSNLRWKAELGPLEPVGKTHSQLPRLTCVWALSSLHPGSPAVLLLQVLYPCIVWVKEVQNALSAGGVLSLIKRRTKKGGSGPQLLASNQQKWGSSRLL